MDWLHTGGEIKDTHHPEVMGVTSYTAQLPKLIFRSNNYPSNTTPDTDFSPYTEGTINTTDV